MKLLTWTIMGVNDAVEAAMRRRADALIAGWEHNQDQSTRVTLEDKLGLREYIAATLLTVARERDAELAQAREEVERLQGWVNDLQAGMYINCVYCGHRYGPDPGTPVAMAKVLKQHIERCPKHPMSDLRACLEKATAQVCGMRGSLWPYLHHLRGCKINPGGKIMAALGRAEPHSCTCGFTEAVSCISSCPHAAELAQARADLERLEKENAELRQMVKG